MSTAIQVATSVKEGDHLIWVIDDANQLKKLPLSKNERTYANRLIGQQEKIVPINQYNRMIYIYCVPDGDKYEVLEESRKTGHLLLAGIKKNKIKSITIISDSAAPDIDLAVAEGLSLSNYQFLKYKQDQKKLKAPLSTIKIKAAAGRKAAVRELNEIHRATVKARDLVNEPLSYLTALQFSAEIEKLGKESGFSTTVLTKKKIEALKMGGVLAVNAGSQHPPTFNILEWKPSKPVNNNPVILVGKGIVYDTGGLSLKATPNSMDKMKSDMAGAAAAIGAISCLAKNDIPLHVIGLIPATDNRPGENAYTPGDVINMHNGYTVEVLNTDAEGRMILADALSYAQKYRPELVLDIATLTGAASRAIGPLGMVMMGTAGEAVKAKLMEYGELVHERLVEFPLWDEYKSQLNSDIADLKNIGGTEAGAITAGKFLEHFTDYPWLHLDIAGVAFLDNLDSYRGKNATGTGVRLLYHFLKSMSETHE